MLITNQAVLNYEQDLDGLRVWVNQINGHVFVEKLIPSNSSFSIPKPQGLPGAAARMHFSSGSHGGKVAGLRLSSSSCASTAGNDRYCSHCESGLPNTLYWLPSTANHSIGRCLKPAIA